MHLLRSALDKSPLFLLSEAPQHGVQQGGERFGLEIRQKKPPKQAPPLKKAAPIFGNDDDDEDEGFGGPQGRGVEREIARQAASKKFNKEVSALTRSLGCGAPM